MHSFFMQIYTGDNGIIKVNEQFSLVDIIHLQFLWNILINDENKHIPNEPWSGRWNKVKKNECKRLEVVGLHGIK